ncbi:MAG: low molecular weight phosphotyrosine protein phosphatase [Rhodobacteraceae bacterium]|nr:MAG: low molecular weight phosphotyrosine protein phosphatase [Paracoccaceae bacterium]
MTTRILFVCLGNICRSPAAEAIVRARSDGMALALDSAGTGDWHVGQPPYAPMQEAAAARGYDLGDLRARTLTPEDFDRFDLIIAMDRENLRDIERLRHGATTPVKLFTDYTKGPETAVPDPYFTRDFEAALDLIESCAEGLLASLRRAD